MRKGLAQLEDVDAIADQFAQLDAEAQNQRTGAEVMHGMVDDAVDAYNMAYQYFAQAEAEDSFDDFFDEELDFDGIVDEALDFVDKHAGDFADQMAGAAKSVAVGKA